MCMMTRRSDWTGVEVAFDDERLVSDAASRWRRRSRRGWGSRPSRPGW